MPLCLQRLGHLTQDAGLAYAGVAANLHITSGIEGLVHRCNVLMSCKDDLAYLIIDVSECLAGVLSEGSTCARVPPVCGKPEPERTQGLQKGRAISIATALGYADGLLNKIPPKRVYPRGIVGMQCAERSFPSEIL